MPITTISARQGQVAAAVEVTEGNEQAIVAADAVLAYDINFNPDVALFTRAPVRGSLSKLPGVPGIKIGTIAFRAEMRGSGNVAQAPEVDTFLRACGLQRRIVDTAAIGAVSSGNLIIEGGEPLTFAPSGATGIAVLDTENGASVLRYVELTGTVANGDTVTGGNSGAQATLSAVPSTNQGFAYTPVSDGVPSLSLAFFNDGIKHLLIGARGNVSADATVGEPGFYSFTFTGVYSETVDEAVLTGTSYDATIPPSFEEIGFGFFDVAAGDDTPCFTTLNADMGGTVEPRLCARAAGGIISAAYTDRNPTGSMDPEMNLVAEIDYYGKLRNGDVGHMSSEWGTVAGNVVGFCAPKAQIAGIAPGDRNNLSVGTLSLNFVTATVDTGDDEVMFVYV